MSTFYQSCGPNEISNRVTINYLRDRTDIYVLYMNVRVRVRIGVESTKLDMDWTTTATGTKKGIYGWDS